MICHVVLIRLRRDLPESAGIELLEQARRLLAPIPVVRNFRLGRGLGKRAEVDYPYGLMMEFENADALQAYQVHPDHVRFVQQVVDPIQDDKKVFDYWC